MLTCSTGSLAAESFVNWIIGSLEYIFYVGVISLVVGVLLWLIQILSVRVLRIASPERVWTLRLWPALLVSLGIICLSLPAAVTRFAPIDLGKHDVQVEGERHITLSGWDQKDYSILARIPDAVVLQMRNEDVTDATLKHMSGMKVLRELDLADTQITDAGLKELEGLTTLEKLFLPRTKITESGLKSLLDKLPKLKLLDVRNTAITPEMLGPWKKALPGRRGQATAVAAPEAEPPPAEASTVSPPTGSP